MNQLASYCCQSDPQLQPEPSDTIQPTLLRHLSTHSTPSNTGRNAKTDDMAIHPVTSEPPPTTIDTVHTDQAVRLHLESPWIVEAGDMTLLPVTSAPPPTTIDTLNNDQALILNLQRRLNGELAMVVVQFLAGCKLVAMGVQDSYEEEVWGVIVVIIAILSGIACVVMASRQACNPKNRITSRAAVWHNIFLASSLLMTASVLVYIGMKFRENPMLVSEPSSAPATVDDKYATMMDKVLQMQKQQMELMAAMRSGPPMSTTTTDVEGAPRAP